MGADFFEVTVEGMRADTAFKRAVKDATKHYGTRSYTGSIKEKDGFVVLRDSCSGIASAQKKMQSIIDDYNNNGYDASDDALCMIDKWGPAGAIRINKKSWLFFGMASST